MKVLFAIRRSASCFRNIYIPAWISGWHHGLRLLYG